ncbi:MAG TPA: hypothetical protein VGT40_17090 [Methylomirabilota bacterium]|jgi:hypothetical protein|nr:hypothetical protein [Methylomirabilota bacterium]
MNSQLIVKLFLSLILVVGLVDYTMAQTSAPSAPTQQQAPQARPDSDRGAAPQPGMPSASPGVGQQQQGSDRPSDGSKSPNVTIESRSETRNTDGGSSGGGERQRVLGMDPMVAVLIGAALLVVIVVALVAMTKRSDDITTRRV